MLTVPGMGMPDNREDLPWLLSVFGGGNHPPGGRVKCFGCKCYVILEVPLLAKCIKKYLFLYYLPTFFICFGTKTGPAEFNVSRQVACLLLGQNTALLRRALLFYFSDVLIVVIEFRLFC